MAYPAIRLIRLVSGFIPLTYAYPPTYPWEMATARLGQLTGHETNEGTKRSQERQNVDGPS